MQRKQENKRELIEGKKFKIAIVVAKFNQDITGKLLEGALDLLQRNKVERKNIKVVWVPGSFEVPLACQKLAKTKKYHALVALGSVIKGETDHYYYISNEVSRGLMNVMLETGIPIGFGVITTNNLQQAKDRTKAGSNKGEEAAQAALEMLSVL